MTDAPFASFSEAFPAAEFSACRTWRYVLRRQWASGPKLGFILLNPSTADETQDDPTIRRCIGFARKAGFGGLVLGNLFALRSTDPSALRNATDAVGPGNDEALRSIGRETEGRVVCGWGAHGALRGRGAEVVRMLGELGICPTALALTKAGEPRHPLYLKSDLKPFPLGPQEIIPSPAA